MSQRHYQKTFEDDFITTFEQIAIEDAVGVSYSHEELMEMFPRVDENWRLKEYTVTGDEIIKTLGRCQIIKAGALSLHVNKLLDEKGSKTIPFLLPDDFDSWTTNQLFRHYGLTYSKSTGKFSRRAKPGIKLTKTDLRSAKLRFVSMATLWIGETFQLSNTTRIGVATNKDQNNIAVLVKKLGMKPKELMFTNKHYMVDTWARREDPEVDIGNMFDACVYSTKEEFRAQAKKDLIKWWDDCKETQKETNE